MALVGTQLAIMACVLCKSDCCKCCCVSVDKKKKKTLKSIKAASAADIYMAPTPEGRRYLPKKSRKPPDPSVIKVNKANAREWRSQEKLWMEKKTGSQGSLHSGYAATPYKYR
uniref:Uncharacterized protein n=1 Tax=Acrobeloides nanus TaxID=290746 RepID=A0A914D900_9BILA